MESPCEVDGRITGEGDGPALRTIVGGCLDCARFLLSFRGHVSSRMASDGGEDLLAYTGYPLYCAKVCQEGVSEEAGQYSS